MLLSGALARRIARSCRGSPAQPLPEPFECRSCQHSLSGAAERGALGSFAEVVLSFHFREDTPDEVLAAFSALEKPHPEARAGSDQAPALPEPVHEPAEHWEPDWREAGYEDEFEAEPWRHDWAAWLSSSMSIGVVPSAALVWTTQRRWNLTCRCDFKSGAEVIYAFLEWLGPFIETWGDDRPVLLGYIDSEEGPRPCLLWAHNGRLQMEDLNATGGTLGA
jgi:hypothetical protein